MPGRPHLDLPRVDFDAPRARRGGGGYKRWPERDKHAFVVDQLRRFDEIGEAQRALRRRLPQNVDPALVMKVLTNQKVDDQAFREELQRAGLRVLQSSPTNEGFWVAFASDESLGDFRRRLQEHDEGENRYQFINAIEDVQLIPPAEKVGPHLQQRPLERTEPAYLDVELWRQPDADLVRTVLSIERLLADGGGRKTDEFRTRDVCLLRVRCNRATLEELLALPQVALVDRPPRLPTTATMTAQGADLPEAGAPSANAPAILLLDSGVASGHPLLRRGIRAERSFVEGEDPADAGDDHGHGTGVAGIAAFGDLDEAVQRRDFQHRAWLLSARILYAEGEDVTYPHDELLVETQLEQAIIWAQSQASRCRVVNISWGDAKAPFRRGNRQFILAAALDGFARRYGVVFVVSTGNAEPSEVHYPEHLLNGYDFTRIIDPASAALALTVGGYLNRPNPQGTLFGPRLTTPIPSPLTRTGPGVDHMVKPDLIENSGTPPYGDIEAAGILVLNRRFVEEGRLFSVDSGTSLAAPKVAYQLARVMAAYPHVGNNMSKALLLSSARIPENTKRPAPLNTLNLADGEEAATNLLRIYGWGISSLSDALESQDNSVVLMHEDEIQVNHVHLYEVPLPREFIETTGDRALDITLTFDPPTRRTRQRYLGNNLEFHLYRNVTVEQVRTAYTAHLTEAAANPEDEDEDEEPASLSASKAPLFPGTRVRSRGPHQKATWTMQRNPGLDPAKPLVLAVLNRNRWVEADDPNFRQDYAVVARVRHTAQVDLFNLIRVRLQNLVRVRV